MYKKDIDKYLNEVSDIDNNLCEKIYSKHQTRLRKDNFSIKLITKKAFIIPCLIFILCLFSIGAYATVEAKEYQEAVEFFEENNLLLDGLTKKEIKKVYKDITTDSFTYELTGKVLVNSIKNNIHGYQIEYDPEKITISYLKSVWEQWKELFEMRKKSVYYDIKHIYDEYGYGSTFYNLFLYSTFGKYDGDDVLWSLDLDYYIKSAHETNDLILLFSTKEYYNNTHQERIYIISLLTSHGEILWEKEFIFNEVGEYGVKIIDNKDNTFSFITFNSNTNIFHFYNLDKNGFNNLTEINISNVKENDEERLGMTNIVNFQDGYLVVINATKIIKINQDGSLEKEYIYQNEDNHAYVITNLIEYNNKVYISGHCINQPTIETQYGRNEIGSILDYLREQFRNDIPVTIEEVTKLLQEHYKAVLLICDEESITPTEFYEVKGALGSKLEINEDNQLVWDVEYIINAMFSPYTSSFTVGGVLLVYNYIFDQNGNLVTIINTKESKEYRRV